MQQLGASRHDRFAPIPAIRRLISTADIRIAARDGEGCRRRGVDGAAYLEGLRLSPHRWRQFELSNDPTFADNLADIVGLYVDLQAHAVALSIDTVPSLGDQTSTTVD